LLTTFNSYTKRLVKYNRCHQHQNQLIKEIFSFIRAFFSSRFIIVDAGQSPAESLVTAAEVSGATFFDATVAALGPVALVAELAAAATPFFLTILVKFLWELWWFGDGGGKGASVVSCKNGGKRRRWQGEKEE
jgi:hypothetical protein